MKKPLGIAVFVLFLTLVWSDTARTGKGGNPYDPPQCTWYAWSRRPDLPRLGHAMNWNEKARAAGFPVLNYPVRGAIVVFEACVQGADWGNPACQGRSPDPNRPLRGHVAYVAEVLSSTTFRIAETNFAGNPYAVNRRTAHTGTGVSFILPKPAKQPRPTRVPIRIPTAVPTIVPTEVPQSATGLRLLQACLDKGYVCLPVPFEITGPISWYNGWEVIDWRVEYLGFDLEPGTVINAPFGGVVRSEGRSGESVGVTLPDGEELVLTFAFNRFAESYSYELLVPDGDRISAGEPFIRYIGEITWVGGPPSDCCEFSGILEIYADGLPIYPVLRREDPKVQISSMMAMDCRDCPYEMVENDPVMGYKLVTYTVQSENQSIGSLKRFIVRASR